MNCSSYSKNAMVLKVRGYTRFLTHSEMHQNINRFIVKLRIRLMNYMIPLILLFVDGQIRKKLFMVQQTFMKKKRVEM